MNSNQALPLGLYKANQELQSRISQLIHDCGQQWLDLGWRLTGNGADTDRAGLGTAQACGGWWAPASFWKQLQFDLDYGQAYANLLFQAQATFAAGLHAAIRTWQEEVTILLSGDFAAGPQGNAHRSKRDTPRRRNREPGHPP